MNTKQCVQQIGYIALSIQPYEGTFLIRAIRGAQKDTNLQIFEQKSFKSFMEWRLDSVRKIGIFLSCFGQKNPIPFGSCTHTIPELITIAFYFKMLTVMWECTYRTPIRLLEGSQKLRIRSLDQIEIFGKNHG